MVTGRGAVFEPFRYICCRYRPPAVVVYAGEEVVVAHFWSCKTRLLPFPTYLCAYTCWLLLGDEFCSLAVRPNRRFDAYRWGYLLRKRLSLQNWACAAGMEWDWRRAG